MIVPIERRIGHASGLLRSSEPMLMPGPPPAKRQPSRRRSLGRDGKTVSASEVRIVVSDGAAAAEDEAAPASSTIHDVVDQTSGATVRVVTL